MTVLVVHVTLKGLAQSLINMLLFFHDLSIQDLQRQVVILKKKEQDETAAMENAIQQVEQNLKTTTVKLHILKILFNT